VQKLVGLYWAYLGPEPLPLIPNFDIWFRKDGQRKIFIQPQLDCNWFQAMENSMDPAHLQILHQDTAGRGQAIQNSTRGLTDDVAAFDFYEVPYGLMKRRTYKNGLVDEHPVIFPNILRQGNVGQIRVPMDDTHTKIYFVRFFPNEDGSMARMPELIQTAWRNYETVPFFLPQGKPPAVGDIFVNREMACAIKLLAEQGRDTFYRGDIAKAILSTSDRLGGTMTAADLAEFSSEWVEPVSVDYRGWKVFQLPPNGQGMAALQILNILENFPPSSQGQNSTEDLHRKIEAMKLAYADLYRYVADTRFVPVPLKELLSKPYAARRALLIDPDKANCDVKPGEPTSGDTTYLTVVDREGNIASWIQSIAGAWGSRVLVDNMGFLLHNRGSGFSLDPKNPNFLAGRKRPFHTIIPAFMEKGDVHIGFGIMGGQNQPLAHAQFASNFIDFRMNLQEALEAPRFTTRARSGCTVLVETRISPRVLQELSAKGHQLDLRKEHSMLMGRGQAVLHNSRTKVNYGASDSRADGSRC
jgi:gamma-glutamyltranspeptidase